MISLPPGFRILREEDLEENRLAWERLKIHAEAGKHLREAVEQILISTSESAWDEFDAAISEYDKWGDRAAAIDA